MANITAALVKELRERTGAGMMECKRALQETGGDLEAAVEHLRKTGIAKAEKKAGRTAAEGLVAVETAADNQAAALVEINCETDFVAKNDSFQQFVKAVAELALRERPADAESLLALELSPGQSVEQARKALIAEIGENVNVRRVAVVEAAGGVLGHYLHGTRIGVVVTLQGGDSDLARDLAMHVAASRPLCVSEDQVPQAVIDKEREIFAAQAADSGKPADIVEKMVSGRIRKYLQEVTLVGQPFVKNPDQTVAQLLSAAGAQVSGFERFELGEGIEKKQENFAEEVMAQARGGSD